MDELREKLASVQHEIWSHWMKYMFKQGLAGNKPEHGWFMPPAQKNQWERLMITPYESLTDKEKESDRHQADKILAVLDV